MIRKKKPKARKVRTKKVNLVLDVVVLGIDSNYDLVTKPACDYRNANVYPYMESRGFRVRKMQGPMARRAYVAPEAAKPEVDYITGIGHGLYNLYTGQYGDAIFQIGDYRPSEARGKIVHFLSCQTGRELGPDFVRNGCTAYFGYDENFTFYPEHADIFFECDSEIDRGFADGLTAKAVYKRTQDLYKRRAAELRAQGKLYVAATLEFDLDHLRSPSSGGAPWGSPSARLS